MKTSWFVRGDIDGFFGLFIDNLLHEAEELYPRNLMFVTWVQDELPHLQCAEAGRRLARLLLRAGNAHAAAVSIEAFRKAIEPMGEAVLAARAALLEAESAALEGKDREALEQLSAAEPAAEDGKLLPLLYRILFVRIPILSRSGPSGAGMEAKHRLQALLQSQEAVWAAELWPPYHDGLRREYYLSKSRILGTENPDAARR